MRDAVFAGLSTAVFVLLSGGPHWAATLGFCVSFDVVFWRSS